MKSLAKKTPAVFIAALLFILLNAVIWLAFAGYTAAGAHPSFKGDDPLRWWYSIGAALVGITLLVLGYLLLNRRRWAYYLGLITLVGFVLVLFLDQMGTIDLIIMLGALIPLILLLLCRRWYFSARAAAA